MYPWTPISSEVTIFVDANHAACHRTRLSTAGGAVVWGKQYLKGWSKTIATVCLSTGESELGSVIKGAAEGLGIQSLLKDLGHSVSLTLASDATAAIGMVKRQGLGKIRHLAVSDLWIQQHIKDGHLKIQKVPGRENPSDIYTKVLSREHCEYLLRKIGFTCRDGRSAMAPVRAQTGNMAEDLRVLSDGSTAAGGCRRLP